MPPTKQKNKMKKQETKKHEANESANSENCNDRNCHIHGNLKVRGRIFEGRVTKKFHKRVVIEFERMIYVRKYERYAKSKTKVHAHLPTCMENKIQIGDLIRVQECRPLSKIIHFAVTEKIKDRSEK